MMKNRKILAVLALGAVMAFAGACGSQKNTNAAAETQAMESTMAETEVAEDKGITGSVTGTIEELKDFMIIINAENGTSYPITFSEKPEGYDDLKVGDKVTVSFTGTLYEVDAFEGDVTSIELAQ